MNSELRTVGHGLEESVGLVEFRIPNSEFRIYERCYEKFFENLADT